MAETYTKKNGRLVNSRGEWVWNGESYEYVTSHSDWLPLVFKSKADSDAFELLEKIWKAEQIVKNSHDQQEVMLAKEWLRKHGVKHSDMGNVVYYVNEDSDFLIHHGIKGQKWGVENGPPYPLDNSVSTGHSIRQIKKYQKKNAKWAKKANYSELGKGLDNILSSDQINTLFEKAQKYRNTNDTADKFKAFQDYNNYTKNLVDSIVGKYGNRKVKEYEILYKDGKLYKELTKKSIASKIDSEIRSSYTYIK